MWDDELDPAHAPSTPEELFDREQARVERMAEQGGVTPSEAARGLVARCVLAGPGHRCYGRPQWHHPIKQQRIKRAFPYGARRHLTSGAWEPAPRLKPVTRSSPTERSLNRILTDERNRVWACWDAHQAIEGDYSRLPESVWEFAREFGLDAQLENDIARQRRPGSGASGGTG